jgi:hypothetical protein
MENKPRSIYEMEDDFCYSCNIISVMADLLTSVEQDKIELADDTLEKYGFICNREAEKLRAMYYELTESQGQSK